MTESYEAWLERVAPQDPLDPGVRRPGADALMRAMFDQKGPISREELALEGRKVEMQLGERCGESLPA